MSTSEEIQAEFELEIAEKSRVVLSRKGGILHFLESEGYQTKSLFKGTLLTEDAKELLQKIQDKDVDWQKFKAENLVKLPEGMEVVAEEEDGC